MSDELVFREDLRPSDPAAVRSIVVSSRFFSDAEVNIAVELVDETLRRGEASGYRFLFTERGGAVVAFSCYGEIPCTVGSYDLYWIAVHSDQRGNGIGKVLARQTEEKVRALGGRTLFAETSGREQYAPTHRFYAACDFELEVRVRDFYAPGDDKLIFARRFS